MTPTLKGWSAALLGLILELGVLGPELAHFARWSQALTPAAFGTLWFPHLAPVAIAFWGGYLIPAPSAPKA